MADEIKGAVAEAVAVVEAELRNADRARVRDLLAAELRRMTGRLDGLAVGLDIAGLSAAALSPELVTTAIEGHVKDVKARLTEQVRLRVLAEARAAEAEQQAGRLEKVKADLCAASLQDSAGARAKIEEMEHQLRNAREDANIAGQECERLQARLAAVEAAAEQAAAVAGRWAAEAKTRGADQLVRALRAEEEAARWEAEAARMSHRANEARVLQGWDWTDGPPAWGEATITVDFAALCPEYDPGPAGTADYVVPQIRLDAFGFKPHRLGVKYHIAAAQRPNGAPLRGWDRPVGPRTSEFFVWIERTDQLPALHIRNAPPSYTPIYALVEAMERRDREAAKAGGSAAKAEAGEADVGGPPPLEPTPSPAPSPAPSTWRLAPSFVERLPEHLRDLRVVTVFRAAESAKAVCRDRNGLFWAVIFGERCGENPAWGDGERQVIEVRRCDAAGDIIPSGDYHAMRYPVALLPVVIPG